MNTNEIKAFGNADSKIIVAILVYVLPYCGPTVDRT